MDFPGGKVSVEGATSPALLRQVFPYAWGFPGATKRPTGLVEKKSCRSEIGHGAEGRHLEATVGLCILFS